MQFLLQVVSLSFLTGLCRHFSSEVKTYLKTTLPKDINQKQGSVYSLYFLPLCGHRVHFRNHEDYLMVIHEA